MINAVSNPVPTSNNKRSFMDTLWFLSSHVFDWQKPIAEEVIDRPAQLLKACTRFYDLR
jgi:hypothetical protein